MPARGSKERGRSATATAGDGPTEHQRQASSDQHTASTTSPAAAAATTPTQALGLSGGDRTPHKPRAPLIGRYIKSPDAPSAHACQRSIRVGTCPRARPGLHRMSCARLAPTQSMSMSMSMSMS
eukprot:6371520-Prymnesium_polylepis.1